MNRNDRISDFLKSGPKRFSDAEELMEAPTANAAGSDGATRHLRGAMYIAGYGIECMLKAYLCDQESCQSLLEAEARINKRKFAQNKVPIRNIARSAAGHNIDYLIRLTDIATKPGYDVRLWGRVAKWTTDWRYDFKSVDRLIAEQFINDVRTAINWIKPKIVTEAKNSVST